MTTANIMRNSTPKSDSSRVPPAANRTPSVSTGMLPQAVRIVARISRTPSSPVLAVTIACTNPPIVNPVTIIVRPMAQQTMHAATMTPGQA